MQPFTLEERLAHARQAEKQLGASVPWLVDAMDNRLKRALGDRPNSEYVIDPQGVIVRKRPWSNPTQLRKDLIELVGPVERETKEADVRLNVVPPPKSPAARGVLARIPRDELFAIRLQPKIEAGGQPFFAKLRAEGDPSLIANGTGKLYLGFHLDPLHGAHWNNLTKPLQFTLDVPEGVRIERTTGESPKVDAASDADPREFLLQVDEWPVDAPVRLTVTYFACVGEEACHAVKQQYVLQRKRDEDGGRARGEGAGRWNPEDFARQMLQRDKNRDGELDLSEVQGLVAPHFDQFDTDRSGRLSFQELLAVSDWLNFHHEPGAKPRKPASSGETK